MKTFLVPVDFSAASAAATHYAAEMALHTGARLILFHVYDNMPPAIDAPLVITSLRELHDDARRSLEKIKNKMQYTYGEKLLLTTDLRLGFTVDEIITYAKERKVDMIVMGMQGAGYLTERFLGSITTMVMKKSSCPVLVIHNKTGFKKIQHIVLAMDGKPVNYNKVLLPLKKLVHIFGAHLHILHIDPAFIATSDFELNHFNEIVKSLEGIEYSLHKHTSNDVVEDINAFARELKADMIVMMPRHHSLIDTVLTEAETKRMAFHTHIPLLALHV